jgi:hypothetical protein
MHAEPLTGLYRIIGKPDGLPLPFIEDVLVKRTRVLWFSFAQIIVGQQFSNRIIVAG